MHNGYIIHNNSARMNQKINEIIWSLNTKNDTLESLVAYIIRKNSRINHLFSNNNEDKTTKSKNGVMSSQEVDNDDLPY